METFLIRCFLWAREMQWSNEQSEQLLEDLATFFAERGFHNDEEGELHSVLVAGNTDVPEPEGWVEELTADPAAGTIVIPTRTPHDE